MNKLSSLLILFVTAIATLAQPTRYPRVATSLSDLQSIPGTGFPAVLVTGVNGGLFSYNAASARATNSYECIAATYGAATGRWIRDSDANAAPIVAADLQSLADGESFGDYRIAYVTTDTEGSEGSVGLYYYDPYSAIAVDGVEVINTEGGGGHGRWIRLALDNMVGSTANTTPSKLVALDGDRKAKTLSIGTSEVATKVDTVADLIAADPTDKKLVQTLGYTAAGDGLGATYRWSSALPDNVQTNTTKWIAGTSGYWALLEPSNRSNLLDLAKGFSFPNPGFAVTLVNGAYFANQSAQDYEPVAVTTYYLNSGSAGGAWGAGDNANDGLSKASPKKSISTLVSALASSPPAGHVKFVLKEGQYYSSTEGFNGVTVNFGLSVVTENGGVAWLPSGRCGAEFTLSAGAVYGRTGHSPTNIFTWTKTDQYGGPSKMTRDNTAYASLAAVQAGLQPDTWTIYNGNCYLRMWDDSVPDVQTMTVSTGSPTAGTIYVQDKDLYLEGLRITGNGSAVRWRSRLAVDKTFAAYNVQAAGGNDTTSTYDLWQLDADTGRAFLENCRADWGTKDGFNYHQNLWYTDPLRGFWVVEVNCSATRNGSSASDNGSTCHEAVHAVRVNGYYVGNSSRNVHDVHEAQTVNINCVAGNAVRTAATDDIAFESGQSGLTEYATKMWLINCESSGVQSAGYDFYAAELSTMTLIGSTGQSADIRTYEEAGASLIIDIDLVRPMLFNRTKLLSTDASTVTITSGGRAIHNHLWIADGNASLEWTGLVDGSTGTLLILGTTTNVSLTLPSHAKTPGGSPLTVPADDWTAVVWENHVVNSTNVTLVNLGTYQ